MRLYQQGDYVIIDTGTEQTAVFPDTTPDVYMTEAAQPDGTQMMTILVVLTMLPAKRSPTALR